MNYKILIKVKNDHIGRYFQWGFASRISFYLAFINQSVVIRDFLERKQVVVSISGSLEVLTFHRVVTHTD
jgi:hypothetical protein